MKKLILYIKEHPNMKFIIGHLYWMELFLEGSKEAFRNVYFDLSNEIVTLVPFPSVLSRVMCAS